MWAAKDNGSDINWTDAKSYCENYRGGGYTDWRMPTQGQLAGLYDAEKIYKTDCGDVHLTEKIRLTCAWVLASDETSGVEDVAFSFLVGKRTGVTKRHNFSRALPVRSVK